MMSTDQQPFPLRRVAAACLLFFWTLMVGGCATSGTGRIASPVQTSGAKPRPLAADTIGRTAESSNPGLGTALAEARTQPSAEHFAEVARRYAALGVSDTALAYFAKSLAVDPQYLPALDGSARLWRDAGYYGHALTASHRATYFAPNSAVAW